MISIVIADDHPVMRAGLAQLLATTDDLMVVGAASDGAEAVELVAREQPRVVLMDLSMPGVDGIEATRRIVADNPDVRVVMLTSFAEHHQIHAALDAGASGYLLKDADPAELLRAVRAAAGGEAPFSPRAASALLPSARASSASPVLTAREEEVLELLVDGLANKQIARRLGISEKTVKAHLTRVYGALGVSDRTQAALWLERRRSSGG